MNVAEMASTELSRLDLILLHALDRFGTVPGKKALQKLVYFLKESGLDIRFQFQWDKYGPYSAELATYVGDLVAEGLVESQTRAVPLSGEEVSGTQFLFGLKERAKKILAKQTFPESDEDKVRRVLDLYRDITARNLELYASVHYLAKFYSTKEERKRLPEGLDDLMDTYKEGRFDPKETKFAFYNLKERHWL